MSDLYIPLCQVPEVSIYSCYDLWYLQLWPMATVRKSSQWHYTKPFITEKSWTMKLSL